MTAEVIASVSRMEGLSVISRTSVMLYKNAQKKIDEIAREPSAGTVIEGSGINGAHTQNNRTNRPFKFGRPHH